MGRVAVITGGTSGIGFSVAEALSNLGGWQVNMIGRNPEKGRKAAAALQNCNFHQANVSIYEELVAVFEKVFNDSQRLDFVFANAGIPETTDLFANQPSSGVPPKPGMGLLDINLNGAFYTSYLAVNYFRRSPESVTGSQSLLLTSSIGGLYPCMRFPIYSGSKHALIGFVRSIGERLFKEGIRVNALCPGVVRTPILTDDILAIFPKQVHIPVDAVADVAMQTILKSEMEDSKGVRVVAENFHSQAIHVTGQGFYFIDQPQLHDDEAQATWDCMMGWK